MKAIAEHAISRIDETPMQKNNWKSVSDSAQGRPPKFLWVPVDAEARPVPSRKYSRFETNS
jgi:hypothetical protein